jgi:hypothetical protein
MTFSINKAGRQISHQSRDRLHVEACSQQFFVSAAQQKLLLSFVSRFVEGFDIIISLHICIVTDANI